MLQANSTLSGHLSTQVMVNSFFFPGQFSGRAALSAVLALAQSHGCRVPGLAELAAEMGIGLPSRVGVQDLMCAAGQLGLAVQLEQLSALDLPDTPQPILLLYPSSADAANMLLLAHCDRRHVLTYDHTSLVPMSNIEPLHVLARKWAPAGTGWCLCVKPRLA